MDALFKAALNTTTPPTTSTITVANDTAAPTQLEDNDDIYHANTVALILPRITAVVSLFAVVCVAMEAWSDVSAARQQKNNSVVVNSNRVRSTNTAHNVSTITRIQLFYQIPLFCHALAFALGTTTAPANLDIWGAVGNTATCEAQGFLLTFGVFGNVGWDVALSTVYLLMVRYNVPGARLAGMEKYYHMIIWPCVLALCIYPLVNDMYNLNHMVCWIESIPNGCVGDECIRGAGATLMQTIVSAVGVLHLLYSITIMLCIYCVIRGVENNRNQVSGSQAAASHSSTMEEATNRRYSRAVAVQGILYASGMVLTTLPTAAYIVLYNLTGLWSEGFGIFATALTPLMGYVNFVVFIRGRTVENCRTRYGKFLRRLHSCLFDYQWKVVCHCQCHCRPTRHHKRRKGDADTAPTTKPSGTGRRDETDSQQQARDDDPFAGTWIIPKETSNQSLISDLELPELEGQDVSPCKPVRLRSQAEVPPAQPRRGFVSQLSDLFEGDDEEDDDDEEEVHFKRSNVPAADKEPPIQAVPCEGEFPQALGNAFSEASEPDERLTRNNRKGRAPPSMPVRLVSEVPEADDDISPLESTSFGPTGEEPPTKPVRLVSEVPESD